ncbi:AroM family protein [Sporosarcina sp. P21c]|uniref:AroM family protein n=1 Tax=unclassified Sporosarcina TaxID=2647733 RepID=UPI000C16ED11|nr:MULTISPECIES: AroM family protein [unclassified Sporosarcina]PIC67569.1 AroM family protein [Sporosarcina sp. P16a]PIC89105.1 AroM family protein [Sporosarcina sp. P21c]PIC93020.1 AroM family protein [Sporosarcina sp. P25]
MTKKVVGVLTIGQSPRTDVTPTIQIVMGSDVTIIESGGLDSLTDETIHSVQPDDTDTIYISRMRNGQSVKIGKSKLLPLLQKELTELESKTDITLMLCTGDFPTLHTTQPIIYPDKVLNHMVSAMLPTGSLGLIIPLEEQREKLLAKWNQQQLKLFAEVASPYEKSDIAGAARALQEQGVDMIVLDCMGYNEEHKLDAVENSGLPVILPRTLIARVLSEYLSG